MVGQRAVGGWWVVLLVVTGESVTETERDRGGRGGFSWASAVRSIIDS